ncbi:MAG: hypothetical protein RQ885_02020 [Desulfurococcales archaeon]|nr:hypothetical protein [Desulfurococcales archaeon]
MLEECPAGDPEAYPPKTPDSLETFRELIERRKKSSKRTVRLRLFPNRYEEEVLFDIGLACARLWNELSYEKRQAFFNRELSPGKRDEINKKYYHKYIRRFLVLMLVRLLIRMMRLGMHSTSS